MEETTKERITKLNNKKIFKLVICFKKHDKKEQKANWEHIGNQYKVHNLSCTI